MPGDFRLVDLSPGDLSSLLNRQMNSVVCMFLFSVYILSCSIVSGGLREGVWGEVGNAREILTFDSLRLLRYAGIPYLLPLDLLCLED